jgi:hypothetical protein
VSLDLLPVFTVLLIGLAVLLMLFVVVLLPRAARVGILSRTFRCPWLGRDVVVRYLTGAGRRPMDVLACTAFADPTEVACDKHCLTERPERLQRVGAGKPE